MIFKIMGSILIVFSSAAIGYFFSKMDKYRCDDLEEFRKSLSIFKSAVGFSAMPLAEVFEDISERVSGSVSVIFGECGDRLLKKQCESASAVWEEVLKSNINKTYFNNEDIEAFFSFGRSLGYLDRQQQLNNADIAIIYIDETRQKLISKNEKEAKIYKSMGVLTGMLIAVVLF